MSAEERISTTLQRALSGFIVPNSDPDKPAETSKQKRERKHRAWCSDKYCEDEAHKNEPKPKEGENK